MTNREKYAKEILDIVCGGDSFALENGVPCKCSEISCGECDLYDIEGCDDNLIKWCNSEYIEPAIDWSKVLVDTPIWVRDSEDGVWCRRHFAKYEDGKVYAHRIIGTSWSNGGAVCCWKYAKLATDDELNANSILRADRRKEE